VTIADRLAGIELRIERACDRSGRSPDCVRVIAVTKTRTPDEIREAFECGIRHVGENRVQEAAGKKPEVDVPLTWHLIGHLQTNKTSKALELFDSIQSLDSNRVAHALQKKCEQMDRSVEVLVEVNTSGERSKFGIEPVALPSVLATIRTYDRLELTGLMTIGPGLAVDNPEASRSAFRLLSELAEDARQRFSIPLPRISMGMTADFEVGVEEGATDVRIGTGLFGPRS
jgi:pyridoxal phosphate enzyme (YggS family)